MYNKGDLLRCKVLSYTDKKLFLTIEPDQVNGSLSFKNLQEEMVTIILNRFFKMILI
jgi:hypothetical protein